MPLLVSALGFLVWGTGRTEDAEAPNHVGTFLLPGGWELCKEKQVNKKNIFLYSVVTYSSVPLTVVVRRHPST